MFDCSRESNTELISTYVSRATTENWIKANVIVFGMLSATACELESLKFVLAFTT